MRKVFLAMRCLAISYTTALAGEFYGTIKEGGKPIKAAIVLQPVGGLLAALAVAGLGFFGSQFIDSRSS